MSTENLFQPTVERLTELVQKQYGCEFSYQTLSELNERTLTPDLRRGDIINAGDWVFFPVFLGARLVGAARISRRDNISSQDLKSMHKMIRMILESKLHDIDRIEMLDQLETHLIKMRENSGAQSNLIQFREFQPNPFPLTSLGEKDGLHFPFLIESLNSEDIFKMALEIHSKTNRYAFLSIEDINVAAFDSLDALKNLGAITIFVADISQLTFAQQNRFIEYYRTTRGTDCPQVIAGTSLPVRELKLNGKVSTELLQALSVGYLHMSQPFHVYKRENMLDFFYESLAGRKDPFLSF